MTLDYSESFSFLYNAQRDAHGLCSFPPPRIGEHEESLSNDGVLRSSDTLPSSELAQSLLWDPAARELASEVMYTKYQLDARRHKVSTLLNRESLHDLIFSLFYSLGCPVLVCILLPPITVFPLFSSTAPPDPHLLSRPNPSTVSHSSSLPPGHSTCSPP